MLAVRARNRRLFYCPGGQLDGSESRIDALIREIREELSVELNVNAIEWLGTVLAQADARPLGQMVRMDCFWYSGILHPVASSEIAEVKWFCLDSTDELLSLASKLAFTLGHRRRHGLVD